ncbi:MAG: hypothetical protein ACFFCP_10745 [Promethearchaeota archaeon]
MKKNQRITLTIALCASIILIAGAYSAIGFPSRTQECSQCHTLTALMTISSNATGTVNAEVGTRFWLVINAASLDTNPVTGSMAVKVYSGWADNSQFSFVDQAIIDNQAGDSNPNGVQITTTFNFTPLAAGSWTLRIWTAAAKGDSGTISQKLDVPVLVTVADTTPPTINSPSDMIVSEGDVTKNITWSPSDANPTSYEVFDNSASWQSGPWDGSPITVQLSSLGLGTHNITLAVWDAAGNSASDEVDVTVVDGTPPNIDSPANVTYSEGATGSTITWDPADAHPSTYEIYRDDVLVKSGTWNSSSEAIAFSVDGLSLGVYNITIAVYDTTSQRAIDTVFVTVYDGTPPTVDSPADIDYPDGDTGNSITWSPTDLHPVSYQILQNGIPVKSSAWNSSGETITISVDGLSIGSYNYTVVLTDIGDNTMTNEVIVTVFNADIPTINSPANQTISEGATSLFVTWSPLDLNPASYFIYQDGVIVKSGAWNSSGEAVRISLDGLSLGLYNFTALVTDLDSNTAEDTVWVTVIDGTAPTIDTPSDITYDEGSVGGAITWNPTDLHPVSYMIYLDGSLVKSGLWNSSGESILISIDGNLVGDYNYTIVVLDVGGNIGTDTVFVYVQDGTPPTIDTPTDINYDEGSAGGSITWDPADTYPISYNIYRDSLLVKSGAWNTSSETVSISVSGLSVGQYNYTIVVYDVGGNSASDLVWVTVSDTTPPTIDTPTDRAIIEGQTGEMITWTPDDLNPMSYEVFRDGALVKSGSWNSSGETISVLLDGLAPGTYNYTIKVSDVGSNSVTDQVNVSVQASTTSPTQTTTSTPVQTTPAAPPIPVDSVLAVVVTWVVVGALSFFIADALMKRYRD